MDERSAKIAARILLKAFEDGIFVRSTANDSQPGWSFRFVAPLQALAQLQEWVNEQ